MYDVSENKFIPERPLKTAVLFMIFNRFDTTKQVFEAIRQAKPPRLYIAADGPRDSRPGEDEKVKTVRDYVMEHIDWACEVKALFREKNLGCKYAVSGNITWFFENEEMGIILEDDCLPCQSFFWFCEELLNKYREDERVWQICGSDYVGGTVANNWGASYRFSKYGPIWGWASWRRAWKYYDSDLKNWCLMSQKQIISSAYTDKQERSARLILGNQLHKGEIDTWDFQWGFAKNYNSALSIIPLGNMIINIGLGLDATHTTNVDKRMPKNFFEQSFPLIHPTFILTNAKLDQKYRKLFVIQPLLLRIKIIIKKALMKILPR